MSYIGTNPATNFETVQKQISTSNSGTTITLDRAVTSVQDILLTIDAVVQSYDNYSVSGTTLTVGGTLSNNRVEILYVGRTMQSVDPTDDSVSAAKIKTDAVTTAKVQNDAITVDKLNLISTSSVPSLEAKGDGGSQDGYIQLNCSQNSHGVKLKSPPHSANQSYTLTLPSTAPATDKILQTNSSGVLSFVDAPSGGLVPVTQSSGSSGTDNVIVNNWISDTYENYEMYYAVNMASTSADLKMTLYDSSGNLSSGNNYEFGHGGVQSSNGSRQTLYGYDANDFQISHNTNNDAGRISVTGKMTWLHPRTSGKRTTILNHFRMLDTGVTNRAFFGSLEYKGTEALTGFYMNASSGQINFWSIKCYGVKNS